VRTTPSPPRLQARAEQPYAAIPITVTLREWGRANALVGEVLGWLALRGIAMAGAPFFRHRVFGGMDGAWELEVGAPVAAPVAGDGRVAAGAVPAGTYAVLEHHGHPDGIRHSIAALLGWAAREGVQLAAGDRDGTPLLGGYFEFYQTDPADEPDPSRWVTEIAILTAEGQPDALRHPFPNPFA
jgi:effector-binding domain-containing protein